MRKAMSTHTGSLANRLPDESVVLLLSLLLPLPLYFEVSGGRVEFAFARILLAPSSMTSTSEGFGIPVGLLAVGAAVALFLVRLVRGRLEETRGRHVLVAGLLVGWMVGVGLYGIFYGQRPAWTSVLLVQAVVPIIFFVAVLRLPVPRSTLRRCFLALPIVGSVSIVAISVSYLYYLLRYPEIQTMVLLRRVFYGALNVQPVVVLVGLAVLLVQFAVRDPDLSRPARWALLLLHGAYLLVTWSRTGLLMIAILLILWTVDQARKTVLWSKTGLASGSEWAIVAAVMLVFGIGALGIGPVGTRPDTRWLFETAREAIRGSEGGSDIESKTSPYESSGSTSGSSRTVGAKKDWSGFGSLRRLALLRGGLELSLASPWVGEAFEPLEPGSIVVGREIPGHRIYPAHNQYLDFAIRSGILTPILFVSFLASAATRLWRNAKGSDDRFQRETGRVLVYLLIAVSIGCLFQLFFVLTQSAGILYFVLGLGLKLSDSDPGDHGEVV